MMVQVWMLSIRVAEGHLVLLLRWGWAGQWLVWLVCGIPRLRRCLGVEGGAARAALLRLLVVDGAWCRGADIARQSAVCRP